MGGAFQIYEADPLAYDYDIDGNIKKYNEIIEKLGLKNELGIFCWDKETKYCYYEKGKNMQIRRRYCGEF